MVSKTIEDGRGNDILEPLGTMLGVFVAATGETSTVSRGAKAGKVDGKSGGEDPDPGKEDGNAESSLIETLASEFARNLILLPSVISLHTMDGSAQKELSGAVLMPA